MSVSLRLIGVSLLTAALAGSASAGDVRISIPKHTKPTPVQKLNQELCAILDEPEVKKKLEQQGADPSPIDTATFAKLIVDDIRKWGDVIRSAGIRPE